MAKLHVVRPSGGDAAFYGQEPTYQGAVFTPEEYKKALIDGFSWHGYVSTREDHIKYLEAWIRENRPETTRAVDLKKWDAFPKALVQGTIPTMARMHMQGFPLNASDVAKINELIDRLPEPAKRERSEDEGTKPVVSVQDRIKAQVIEVLGELDECADILTDGDGIDIPSMQEVIFDPSFKEPHFRFIIKHLGMYLAQWNEIVEARASKDPDDAQEQLIEGTRHLKPKLLKNAIQTFEKLQSLCSGHIAATKSTKVRKKKPVDKAKVVGRLRFAKEHKDLGLKAIDTTDILGANELWVYDSKRRRLQHYVGETANSLYVKGPKIMGYSKNSGSKVLRKPEEQLKEFMALRKNQTEKWFEGIRAKAAPLNGRSADYLIPVKVA